MSDYENIYQGWRKVNKKADELAGELDKLDSIVFHMSEDEPNYEELCQKMEAMSDDWTALDETREAYRDLLNAFEYWNDILYKNVNALDRYDCWEALLNV